MRGREGARLQKQIRIEILEEILVEILLEIPGTGLKGKKTQCTKMKTLVSLYSIRELYIPNFLLGNEEGGYQYTKYQFPHLAGLGRVKTGCGWVAGVEKSIKKRVYTLHNREEEAKSAKTRPVFRAPAGVCSFCQGHLCHTRSGANAKSICPH